MEENTLRKNIYVPDDKIAVFEEAEKLFKGERSISQLIIEALEKEIQLKKDDEEYQIFDLTDKSIPVKLKGKLLASYFGIQADKGKILYDISDHKIMAKISNKKSGWFEGLEDEYGSHVVYNAYQTKSGKLCIETKYIKYDGVNDSSSLEMVEPALIIEVLTINKNLYDSMPDDLKRILKYPRKLLENIRNTSDKRHYIRYIE